MGIANCHYLPIAIFLPAKVAGLPVHLNPYFLTDQTAIQGTVLGARA